MDEIDADILRLLSEDARMNYVRIAEKLPKNLQDTSVRKRVMAMQKNKVIQKFTMLVNTEKFPVILTAAVVDINPAHLKVIQKHFNAIENVTQMFYDISGTMICFIGVSKDEDLSEVLKEMNEIPGVNSIKLYSNLRVSKYDSLIGPKVIREVAKRGFA